MYAHLKTYTQQSIKAGSESPTCTVGVVVLPTALCIEHDDSFDAHILALKATRHPSLTPTERNKRCKLKLKGTEKKKKKSTTVAGTINYPAFSILNDNKVFARRNQIYFCVQKQYYSLCNNACGKPRCLTKTPLVMLLITLLQSLVIFGQDTLVIMTQ